MHNIESLKFYIINVKNKVPSYRSAPEESKLLATVIDGSGDPISNDSSISLRSPEKIIEI